MPKKPVIAQDIRDLLLEQADRYNRRSFIPEDPVSVPHRYSRKEDIEISGFLTASLSWGNRRAILASSLRMMELFDDAPYDFVMHATPAELKRLSGFVHRTFNDSDLRFFIRALRFIYREGGGMETLFTSGFEAGGAQEAIHRFRRAMLSVRHEDRSTKHIADPMLGSAAKRINMFLRWMVRRDDRGVDFGLWQSIPMNMLSIPLDVHTGQVARELGLLTRRQSDWKAVEELDAALRSIDPADPVRLDYALFGIGVNRKRLTSEE